MASPMDTAAGTPLLLVGDTGGITVVSPSTPLRRLNYFDGKFLRADDFMVEQSYLRELVALSNQGLGPGVVYGYDTTQAAGDAIQVGPGLAIDPSGKVLLLQHAVTQGVQALIDATRKRAADKTGTPDASSKSGGFSDCIEIAAPPPSTVVQTSDLYVIAICAAEALCGQEDVYGIACQEACISTSDRPYRLDGIVLRAIPLQLTTPIPTSKAVDIGAGHYLRTKVAQSWFADEQLRHPSAVSRAGLLTEVWCLGAGYAFDCCEVPLAVVARSGAATLFLDAWTVRRERIDAPARRYWQWKMRMRPWDVFLAQVLQFQCQLAGLLAGVVVPGERGGDPCADAHAAIGDAARFVEQVHAGLASYRNLRPAAGDPERPALLALSLTGISDLGGRLRTLLQAAATPAQPADRVLIRGGIVELPPAGYLPVVSGAGVSVNAQVRALLGEGPDLRFCICSADYIAHAIEEAQHMDRISLLQGLDDPGHKPRVDILVPDGEAATGAAPAAGLFSARLTASTEQTKGIQYQGAAREHAGDGGGIAFHLAGAGLSQNVVARLQAVSKALMGAAPDSAAITPNLARNAFVRTKGKLGIEADAQLANEAQLARRYTSAFASGAAAKASGAAAKESVDGFWLDLAIDRRIRTLGAGSQTPVAMRMVLANRGEGPVANDVGFRGTLTIGTVAAGGPAFEVKGTVRGVLAVAELKIDPAHPQTINEDVTTRSYEWPVSLVYSGDAPKGTLEVDLAVSEARDTTVLRLTRSDTGAVQSSFRLALVTRNAAGGPVVRELAELGLVADANVADAGNVYHRFAVNGLDLVQAALVARDPQLESRAEALLFPAPRDAGTELVIQALRDWVAFTKRRETECRREAAPPPPLPPRSYRVLSHRVDSAQQAGELAKAFKSPDKRAEFIRFLLDLERRAERPALILRFAGGSTAAESDLGDAAKDWKGFSPGADIHYSAAGAAGESDAPLQLGRLRTFLDAIVDISKEAEGAGEDAILPWPDKVVLDDADGVIVVITVEPPKVTEAIHVYGGNHDAFGSLHSALQNPALTSETWRNRVAQVGARDLGLAPFTVGAPDAIKDDDVRQRFAIELPGQTVTASLLMAGDPAGHAADRLAAARKLVKDLDGAGTVPANVEVYAGTWFADAESILLLECRPRDQ